MLQVAGSRYTGLRLLERLEPSLPLRLALGTAHLVLLPPAPTQRLLTTGSGVGVRPVAGAVEVEEPRAAGPGADEPAGPLELLLQGRVDVDQADLARALAQRISDPIEDPSHRLRAERIEE